MREPFTRGLIAGFVAGIVKDIPDVILYWAFHLKQLLFWDYMGVVAFNKKPSSFLEYLLAFGFEVMFSTCLGVLLSMIAAGVVKTRHYLLEGMIFGGSIWFSITVVVRIFHLQELIPHNLLDPFLTMMLSLGYGILVMSIDHYLAGRQQS